MVDGAALLMTMFRAFLHAGTFDPLARGGNILDTGEHYYDVYETSDGKYVSVGPAEEPFYAVLLRPVGLDSDTELPRQSD
jgi:alpha-methylacyl-CoA racemase